jgi:hypothetical protein
MDIPAICCTCCTCVEEERCVSSLLCTSPSVCDVDSRMGDDLPLEESE